MIITCEKCNAQYEVPEDFLDKGSRKVKCDNCGNIWFQKTMKEQIYDQLEKVQIIPEEQEPVKAEKSKEQLIREQKQNHEYDEKLDEEMKNVFDDIASKVEEISKAESDIKQDLKEIKEELRKSENEITEVVEAVKELESKETFIETLEAVEEKVEQIVEKTEDAFQKTEEQILKDIKAEAKDIENKMDVARGEAFAYLKLHFAKVFAKIKTFHPISEPAVTFGFMVFLSLIFTTASVLLVGKGFIINRYPQTMIMYNKIGLKTHIPGEGIKISNLSANQEKDGLVYNILIKGEILNATDKDLRFPKLVVLLKDKENKVLGKWTPKPDRKKVEAGKTYPFELRFFDVSEEGVLTEVTVKN